MKFTGIFAAVSLLRVVAATAGPSWVGLKGLRYHFVLQVSLVVNTLSCITHLFLFTVVIVTQL